MTTLLERLRAGQPPPFPVTDLHGHLGQGVHHLEVRGPHRRRLTTIRQLTNNPKKIVGLEGYGLSVTERVPIEIEPGPDNLRYLQAKRDKMGHMLHHQDLRLDVGAGGDD